jgi:hypothetical protein
MLSELWNRIVTFFAAEEVLLRPTVDFDETSGNLRATIKGDIDGKAVRLSRRSITRGHGSFRGRRFRVNPYDFKIIRGILAFCEWTLDFAPRLPLRVASRISRLTSMNRVGFKKIVLEVLVHDPV